MVWLDRNQANLLDASVASRRHRDFNDDDDAQLDLHAQLLLLL